MKRKLWIGALAALLVAGLLYAQVPGKYLGFTPDRFWKNDGSFRTDSTIESFGASNTLKLAYNESVYATLALGSTGALTVNFSGGTANALLISETAASATPGTVRAIYGKYTTGATMTSGNLVGTRGEITIPNSGAISGSSFLYGTQGKVITGTGTIDVGSSMVYGVMGQLDISGGTITSGYVAGVGSDIYGLSTGTKAVDLFYGQHADGGTGNAMFRAYGKFTSVFEIDDNGGGQVSLTGTPGAVTGGTGWLKIKVNGTVRYIPLAESVS